MYTFIISDSLLEELRKLMPKYPSIENKIVDLSINPFARALPTNLEVIGAYYANCGRHCLLFDVHEETEQVELLKLVHRAYLYKLKIGKISLEDTE